MPFPFTELSGVTAFKDIGQLVRGSCHETWAVKLLFSTFSATARCLRHLQADSKSNIRLIYFASTESSVLSVLALQR